MYSIVIPTYNSSKFIDKTINEIDFEAKKLLKNYEIIIVNDCSTDNTEAVLSNLNFDNKQIKTYHLSKNEGQIKATLFGIQQAKASTIITVDDDLEYDFGEVEKHLDKLKDFNLIYLYSSNYNHSLIKKILHTFYTKTSLKFKGIKISSFRIFKKSLIESSIYKKSVKHHTLDLHLIEKARKAISFKIKYQKKNKSRYTLPQLIKIYSTGLMNFFFLKK